MSRSFFTAGLVVVLFFLADCYAFQAIETLLQYLPKALDLIARIIYWSVVFLGIAAFLLNYFTKPGREKAQQQLQMFAFTFLFIIYFSKLVLSCFVFMDDLQRAVNWTLTEIVNSSTKDKGFERSTTLAMMGIFFSAVPLLTLSWGIFRGAHNYKIKTQSIFLKDLPTSFDGFKIVQLSDIHIGSLWNRKAVEKGIAKVVGLKADVVLFTGDLVNNKVDELKGWEEILAKIKAPKGVYSILGNHDYGDYIQWPSAREKKENLKKLINFQKGMGWDLLLDENREIRIQQECISIIGVQNWSARSNFRNYGNLMKAQRGSEEASVKILMSHDPSHWKAEVTTKFPDIDLVLSGHTHGMQFGVEVFGFKWSPIQYFYREWAGLYQKGKQYLYVNRGFGYLGYLGRFGIAPEISLITLRTKSKA